MIIKLSLSNIVVFCMIISSLVIAKNTEQPLLGLVMIVKNEAYNMAKTIQSVKPYVDRWTILDTGSTDGTQDIIRREFLGVPGDLFQEPFVDFGATRNRVLELADQSSVFVLMLNGDDTLINGEALREFCEQYRYESHASYVMTRTDPSGSCNFGSRRLIRTRKKPRFVGRTHEYLDDGTEIIVPNVYVMQDAPPTNRKKQIRQWNRDLHLLTEDYEENPDSHRTVFYLAQTNECLGNYEEAFVLYDKRGSMGGWQEEVYEALYRKARVAHKLGRPLCEVQEYYLDAFEHSYHRAEPLYDLAKIYSDENRHALAYLFALRAAQLPYPRKDILFVDQQVYRYKCNDLLGISGWYIGEYQVGEEAAKKALEQLPEDGRLRANLAFYQKRKEYEIDDVIA